MLVLPEAALEHSQDRLHHRRAGFAEGHAWLAVLDSPNNFTRSLQELTHALAMASRRRAGLRARSAAIAPAPSSSGASSWTATLGSGLLEGQQTREVEGGLVEAAALEHEAGFFSRLHDAGLFKGVSAGGFAGTWEQLADALEQRQ